MWAVSGKHSLSAIVFVLICASILVISSFAILIRASVCLSVSSFPLCFSSSSMNVERASTASFPRRCTILGLLIGCIPVAQRLIILLSINLVFRPTTYVWFWNISGSGSENVARFFAYDTFSAFDRAFCSRCCSSCA